MKKIFVLLFLFSIFLVSCAQKPLPMSDDVTTGESTQPAISETVQSNYQTEIEYEINPIADSLFSGDSEKLTFDGIIKDISNGNMTAELIDESKTDAKISKGNDNYYTVYSNPPIRISALDTLIRILNDCAYIEIEPLNEPVIYTFIFHASDINGNDNEICIYVTRSCIKIAYNGVSDGKEYINIAVPDGIGYKNVSAGYDLYIDGIIPDENGGLATIW